MVGRSLMPTHWLAKATTWNREIAMRVSKQSGFGMGVKANTECREDKFGATIHTIHTNRNDRA